MAAKALPAAAGWQWWKSAFGLLLRAPKSVPLCSILFTLVFFAVFSVLAFVLTSLASSTVAVLILMLVALATGMASPVLFLGLMSIFRSADRGESPLMAAFMQPFGERLLPLAVTGLLITVFTMAVQLLIILMNGQGIIDGLLAMCNYIIIDPSSVEALSAEDMSQPFLLCLLTTAVAVMLGWYSFFLVGWHDTPVISALKKGFTATLKNWAPFLVCFLVYFVSGAIAIKVVLSLLITILVWIIPKWILIPVAIVGIIIFFAVINALLFGAWYYSYKTVYGEQEPTPK
jgi:hypothetical protein